MLVLEKYIVDFFFFAFRQTSFPIDAVGSITRGEGLSIFNLKHPGLRWGLGGFLSDFKINYRAVVDNGCDLFELLLFHFLNIIKPTESYSND